MIEEVLNDTGRAGQRERLLPVPAVIYFVMALSLWREAPLEEVLRAVCEGLHGLGDERFGGGVQASKSAISQARTRLGAEIMRELAQRVLRPLAAPGAPGAWYRGLRVTALDGSCMDVADEKANAEFFGCPGASRGSSAFPQARLMGLHAVVAADIAPFSHSDPQAAAVPPKRLMAWRDALLEKISRGRCASSRGRLNSRGVKRKMSNFNIRRRGTPLPQVHQPVPVLRI